MALQLLRVIALGVLAVAATDDIPITVWDGSPLGCQVALASRLAPRRPPPPLDAGDHRRARVYSWTHDGEEVSGKRISPDGTLELTRRSGEGVYQCSVRHHGGLVLGYPLHVKFPSMEKQFHIQPENATARVGQPVVLTCQITSSPPALVSWLRNGDPVPEDPRYHVLTNQLLITDLKKEDAGLYRCMATNKQMNKTRVSHRGRVQVDLSPEDVGPSFLEMRHEGNLTVPRWSRVVLPCPVVAWPRPELIWQFTPPNSRTAELDVVDEVLVIPQVELDQEGLYTCRVAGTDVTKTFNVTISEPVTIVIPPVNKEAIRAKTVRFNCTATGKPEPYVEWYKDGQKLPLTGRAKILKNTDRLELVISTVTKDDAGVYQCFASNGISVASSWAVLNVTGDGAAPPSAVRCMPVDARAIALTWTHPDSSRVVAYTVHYMSTEKSGSSLPFQPQKNIKETVTVEEALTPYQFQVRAYVTSSELNIASDMSQSVQCQGQGVPIKIVKLQDDTLMVTWREFAEQNPGVVEWMLQYRKETSLEVQNVTLEAHVLNYTLTVSPTAPLYVRLLGTRRLPWLLQDLALVKWTSTAQALEQLENGVFPVPTEVQVIELSPQGFTIKWRCDEADKSPEHYVFIVCFRKREILNEDCSESYKSSHTVEGLEPDTEYEVRVQARREHRGPGGAFSPPYLLRTLPVETQRFKEIQYKFVNSTSVSVWWGGPDSEYQLQHSSELKLPVDVWTTMRIYGNNATFNIDEKSNKTFVMVTGYDPYENSKILTIDHVNDLKNLSYQYSSDGIQVSWKGSSSMRYSVKYSQQLTVPMEQWREVNVSLPLVQLKDLDPELPTHVTVTSLGPGRKSQTLTIPPPPPEDGSSLYLSLGVGAGVIILWLLVMAALCVWRRRKQSRSPVRSRRRNTSTNQSNEEGASEMTNVGGRLANGVVSRGAGEPLLNGDVNIIENPTLTKTSNGKTKKSRRQESAFDVSRYEDPDATLETVLDPDTSTSTTFNLLDTSRKPEFDSSRSSPRDVSVNNSFTKLPDDNMNSELTRSTDYIEDNSKSQPTLQPNG